MGEAKDRREKLTPHQRQLQELSRALTDQGKLVEAGWVGLRLLWVPQTAPPGQIRDLRWAFMAGAQHLFSSIMTILEPGAEPTDKDLTRMDLIAAELAEFAKEAEDVMAKSMKTKGSA
jgi:hypothetical protein